MLTVLKVIAIALFTGFAFLIAKFTDEYFRPYKRKD